MDAYDFEEENETMSREDYILKNWTARMSNESMKAKNFQQLLRCEMSVMRVKFPFLEESQLRGRALKKLNIPSICGQIPK